MVNELQFQKENISTNSSNFEEKSCSDNAKGFLKTQHENVTQENLMNICYDETPLLKPKKSIESSTQTLITSENFKSFMNNNLNENIQFDSNGFPELDFNLYYNIFQNSILNHQSLQNKQISDLPFSLMNYNDSLNSEFTGLYPQFHYQMVMPQALNFKNLYNLQNSTANLNSAPFVQSKNPQVTYEDKFNGKRILLPLDENQKIAVQSEKSSNNCSIIENNSNECSGFEISSQENCALINICGRNIRICILCNKDNFVSLDKGAHTNHVRKHHKLLEITDKEITDFTNMQIETFRDRAKKKLEDMMFYDRRKSLTPPLLKLVEAGLYSCQYAGCDQKFDSKKNHHIHWNRKHALKRSDWESERIKENVFLKKLNTDHNEDNHVQPNKKTRYQN